MENKSSQVLKESSCSPATITLDSMAVPMVLAIPKSFLTALEALAQLNQYNTDQPRYVKIICEIIKKLL